MMFFVNSVGLLGCMEPAGLGCSVVCKYLRLPVHCGSPPLFEMLCVESKTSVGFLGLPWMPLASHSVLPFPLQVMGILLVLCRGA